MSENNEQAMELQPSSDASLQHFKDLHDEAYLYVDMGLTCDSQQQAEQAVLLYIKGLSCIERALAVDYTGSQCTGPEWEKVRGLTKKMQLTKGRIESRRDFLLANNAAAARMINDPPPSYEVSISPTSSEVPSMNLMDGASSPQMPQNATALFVIPDGVQIFFITAAGAVSAPSYPASLAVYCFNEHPTDRDSAPAFLQVGDWVYPLLPGRSPALRSDYGAYMFPDVTTEEQGRSVGVIIPSSVASEEHALFNDLLHNFTAFRSSGEEEKPSSPRRASTPQGPLPCRPPPPRVPEAGASRHGGRRASEPASTQTKQASQGQEEPTSVTISKGIVTGAEWISWGLKKGAEKTGHLMKQGSTALKHQIQPNQQATPIDPRAQQAAKVTRQVAGAAVTVSGFIITTLGKATMAIGREVAPHIKKHGAKLLPDSIKKPSEEGGRSTLDDVVTVAAGGLQGFGTVYMGLEHAAIALGRSLADETTAVVKHKYGRDAGQLTENSMYAAGAVGMTAYNASALGIKAIAKRTAKDMGKATIEHMDHDGRAKQRRASQEDEDEDDGSNHVDKSTL